jgi:16S rRNA (guanine527-N7)-methyltransferase
MSDVALSAGARARLIDGARSLGVELDARDVERLARLVSLLQTWNRKINLTAVDDEIGIVERHLLDSLAVVPHIGSRASTLVDVGSGPGFPGLVLATVLPDLRVTSVESIQKKTAFQIAVRQALGLTAEVLAMRDDALVRAGRTFDVAISRATFEPSEWLRHAVPLVRPEGRVIAMLTADAPPLDAPPELTLMPRVSYEIAGVRRVLQLAVRNDVPRGTDASG